MSKASAEKLEVSARTYLIVTLLTFVAKELEKRPSKHTQDPATVAASQAHERAAPELLMTNNSFCFLKPHSTFSWRRTNCLSLEPSALQNLQQRRIQPYSSINLRESLHYTAALTFYNLSPTSLKYGSSLYLEVSAQSSTLNRADTFTLYCCVLSLRIFICGVSFQRPSKSVNKV